MTPGQNEKRYLAGALDARTGLLYWVEGKQKNSTLFVALLAKLVDRYPEARVIHLIVDNYRIHTSKIANCAPAAMGWTHWSCTFCRPIVPMTTGSNRDGVIFMPR